MATSWVEYRQRASPQPCSTSQAERSSPSRLQRASSGYDRDFAERTFRQLEGFGSYGFPMSQAASFAILAYASSWMKHHHPDVFLAALLNSRPMGFYAPAQLVACARRHGVEVRPVCVNRSAWDCTLEPCAASTRISSAISPPIIQALRVRRVHDTGGSGFSRRSGQNCSGGNSDTALPLFAASEEVAEPAMALKPATAGREVVEDYGSTGLSLKAHPLAFLRRTLAHRGVTPAAGLAGLRDGRRVKVAGLVLVRQRPGSAKSVMFITLEDETGPLNVIVWPSLFERSRRTVVSAGMMRVAGRLQREAGVIHVVAERLVDLSSALRTLGERGAAFPLPQGHGDEVRTGGGVDQRTRAKPPLGVAPRDIYIPDLPRRRRPAGIRVRPRNFR